ncbi:MAG: hypothetical protein RLZZ399_2752 [Verrucomicrobiota bacterium]
MNPLNLFNLRGSESSLSRRSFLRGSCGAALALPWLESLNARAGAIVKPAQRMAFFYVPMGVIRDEFFPGEQKKPEQSFTGVHAHISTRTLSPLDKMGAKVTLVTGLGRTWKDTADQHEQAGCCFLSSMAPRDGKSSRMPQGRTLDHIVGERLGSDTPFRTLEFNCNPHRDNRESIHFDTMSWYGPEYPAVAMRDPQLIYRRLFTSQVARPGARITDLVLADAKAMSRGLGREDRDKLGEYVESIRTIERQMDRLGGMRAELEKMKLPEPAAAYLPRGEYLRMIGDFMVAALQSGLTHVATMMVAPERWETPYRFEEISEKPLGHHSLSHGGWSEELRKIDEFHVRQFAYLLEKMDGIREADGTSLLDNTIFTYGSGLGHGATHSYKRLPIVVAGSGGGKLKTGFHLQCKDGAPLANLWLTQAQVVGLERESFAESTGVISEWLA